MSVADLGNASLAFEGIILTKKLGIIKIPKTQDNMIKFRLDFFVILLPNT